MGFRGQQFSRPFDWAPGRLGLATSWLALPSPNVAAPVHSGPIRLEAAASQKETAARSVRATGPRAGDRRATPRVARWSSGTLQAALVSPLVEGPGYGFSNFGRASAGSVRVARASRSCAALAGVDAPVGIGEQTPHA